MKACVYALGALLLSSLASTAIHAQESFGQIKLGTGSNTVTLQGPSAGGATTFQFPSGGSTVLTQGSGQVINGSLTLGNATLDGSLTVYGNLGDSSQITYDESNSALKFNSDLCFSQGAIIRPAYPVTGNGYTLVLSGGNSPDLTTAGSLILRGGRAAGSGTPGPVRIQTFDNGGVYVGVSSQMFRGIYSATATLDFPTVPANSMQELTINLGTATTGDPVMLATPSSVEPGLCFMAYMSASGVATVRCLNVTTGAIDPASGSFRVTVVHY